MRNRLMRQRKKEFLINVYERERDKEKQEDKEEKEEKLVWR